MKHRTYPRHPARVGKCIHPALYTVHGENKHRKTSKVLVRSSSHETAWERVQERVFAQQKSPACSTMRFRVFFDKDLYLIFAFVIASWINKVLFKMSDIFLQHLVATCSTFQLRSMWRVYFVYFCYEFSTSRPFLGLDLENRRCPLALYNFCSLVIHLQ